MTETRAAHTPGRLEKWPEPDARGEPSGSWMISQAQRHEDIAVVTANRDIPPEVASANARRLCAAWNFVGDTSTEALEGSPDLAKILSWGAINKGLLTALKDLLRETSNGTDLCALCFIHAAQDAVTRAEGV